MDRLAKKQWVESMNSAFNETALVVVAKHEGLTVAEVSDLRVQVRAAGASFKVTKNKLARLALKETQHEGLTDYFDGPTAVAYSQDPVAAAKVIAKFAKGNDKISILAGGLSGQILSDKEIKALAELPSLDELRSKLLGLFLAPQTKVATLMNAPATQLARVISAYAAKG